MPLDHWSDPGFLSAGLWLTSMTNVSTFPFLMRSAKRGEGNKLLERLWQFTRRSYRLHLTWLFFCSTRTYTVPDPPDLFDGHVWPMYLKHRKEMDNNCSRIGATNHKSLQTLHATTLLCLSNHIPWRQGFNSCCLFSGQSTLTGWHRRTISTTRCTKAYRTPCWTTYR